LTEENHQAPAKHWIICRSSYYNKAQLSINRHNSLKVQQKIVLLANFDRNTKVDWEVQSWFYDFVKRFEGSLSHLLIIKKIEFENNPKIFPKFVPARHLV